MSNRINFSFSLPRPDPEPDPSSIDTCLAIAEGVERSGLEAVSVSDHPFPLEQPGQAGHQAHDPFVMLGYLAGATSSVRLHFSLIVLPYRNPFLVARMLGTLDLVSRGRVIAALGLGYLRPEFEALGADREHRVEDFAGSVAAMRAAWTGEPVTLSGRGWRAAGNRMLPVPFTSPHPVLWCGGNTQRAIDHAVRDFDGWSPFEVNEAGSAMTRSASSSLSTLPDQLAGLRESIERQGRTTPIDVCFVRTSRRWHQDESRAIDELGRLAELGVTWVEFTVAGTEAAEIVDNIDRFAELARRAGVRD